MSVYTQEVLGLLKRNKKKRELDKIRDHFEFGKLYQNSSLNTGAAYNPRMEPFVIKWGDFKCATEEGMVRQDPTGTQERYITMWTDPVFQGECQTATITKTIISQNAIGDTINIAGDLYVDGTITTPTLTEDRIVIVGPGGVLEDDGNFTMDGTTFTANVNVVHGTDVPAGVPTHTTTINSNLKLEGPVYDSLGDIGSLNKVLVGLADGRVKWQDDDVVEALTYGSLWQGDATNYKVELPIGTIDQILISDGTTFSWEDNPAAIVGEVCAVNSIPLWTPNSNTLGCSKLFQDGNDATPATKVTSSVTFNVVNTTSSIINIGNVAFNGTNRLDFIGFNNFSSGLSGTSDGVKITPMFYTSIAIDAYVNYIEFPYDSSANNNKLTIGGAASEVVHPGLVSGSVQILPDLELEKVDNDNTLDKVLVRDATTGIIKQRDASSISPPIGSGTLYRLPLWTPDGTTLGDSLLIQDGNVSTPATQVTNDGILINTGVVKLDSVANDDSLVQVLVRDTGNSNEIKYRAASSIKPQVGFDTLAMTPDGWASTDGNFNAFVNLDDSVTAFKNINNMTWLVDGDRVVVIAANNKTGTILADSVLRFKDWVYPGAGGRLVTNFGSWVPSSSDLAYPTATLLYGEKVKFKAEMYDIPSTTNSQLNWDACCKIRSANLCPTGSNGSTTMDEDTTFTGAFNGIDDGYGGYGLTYSIVTPPSNGTVTITNASTGAFTYTPTANYFGTDSVTWKVNDGYCDSIDYTFTFTINATDDAPRWTSTDPVTLNTYPTLTGGDAWTYSWTVADDDTACASLTFPSQTIPSWLTFTNNGDCTGTLSGTYPTAGGNFAVQLNVSDGTDTASQSFNIGGLAVTEDTYFVNWFDGSGSMDTTGAILSANSSTPLVRCQSNGAGSGTVALTVQAGSATANVGIYVDDTGGNGYKAFKLLVPGMTVSGTGIAAGTTIATVSNQNITLSAAHTTSTGDIITFARTTAQKTTDYNDGSTFRNLLQDFYATGGTEASGNTNSATNGADEYDSHVFFGWDGYNAAGNGERQIQYLANLGNPITGAGTKFTSASTVVVMAWGDESDDWYTAGGTPFASQTSVQGARVVADVSEVQTFIQDAEADASNNTIYRGIWFSVGNSDTNYRNIGQGLQNGISPASQFSSSGWNNGSLLVGNSSGTPTRIQYAGQTGDTDYVNGVAANNANVGYYRGVVLAKLQDSGFSTLT